MSEKLEGVTPQQESKEIQAKRFESAIKKFFREQWTSGPEIKKLNHGYDFDISAPKTDEIRPVQSGNFKISCFETSPTSDSEKLRFHFYVGNKDFFISGKAAYRVYELIKEE
ncbi:MAG: hypothetical protein COT91_03615 [Candidatus Doudnabacteria bacterium CG10_big_fil_rev_8_21_14_0_10_41_10]|uniref:Uncharacterized protein n=1 Tax=Candidatus Doudnabacteria bacterium CG10_big_fil_rev_8_21_14_0_10_41_10 TaxID=1974551 RepID=A0A2H0VCY5_9BACT|nr:MAG: hypothetical protein COT91_03615 [Candidatus Doudnabacteria bacterium CG10_big_fil_rev_8_21_14_0_10_41_10]